MIFILLPFFEGEGEKGMKEYIETLATRGDVVDIDGHWEWFGHERPTRGVHRRSATSRITQEGLALVER
jgi:hypothetical protein